MNDAILATVEGHVGRLTIHNPAKRNAFSYDMWRAAADILLELADRDDVRVVVITGAGDLAFSAGNDISEFGEWRSSKEKIATYDLATERAYDALRGLPKPTVARIRGFCVGGGFEFAQLCDIRVASDDSRFGVTPAKLGLGYKLEDVELLIDCVGVRAAKELLFTGRLFDAAEALRLGALNRVVPAAALDHAVAAYTSEIARNAPLSVRAAKVIIGEAMKDPAARDRSLCRRLVDTCYASEDYQEGQRAFAEKRRPDFRGR